MKFYFKLLPDGIATRYMTDGAAGMDIYARESRSIWSGERALIPCGFALELPPGFEAQIRPRSGMGKNSGVFASFGTVDSDYRGEVCVLLFNFGGERYTVRQGDRIAQLVLSPVVRAELLQTDELDDTARGAGGFGSTGDAV